MATWSFDPGHSNADFSVRHMMITNVRGGFKEVSGTIEYDPANPGASSVNATINAGSIWTGVADRDGHLRSGDFLDVENYPTITFVSTNVNVTGENKAEITGDLTVHGVTKSVVLNTELLGVTKNPFTGTETAGFTGTAKINREDFGLTWNQALEAGGVLVGKDINITLDVEAVPVTETANA
ncbi:MAG: YceI family protein [Aggregatilineales bacterium]